MIVRCPLPEFELSDQHGFKPSAILHLGRREALPPSAAARLRKIGERTFRGLQPPEYLHELSAPRRREAVPRPRHIDEVGSLVIAEHERIEGPAADGIAPDHKLLSFVDAHLHPCAGPLARLIPAIAPFSDQ